MNDSKPPTDEKNVQQANPKTFIEVQAKDTIHGREFPPDEILALAKKLKNYKSFSYARRTLERATKNDAVNLNGERSIDLDLCPPIIRDEYVVHIPFKMKIIKYSMNNFPNQYHNRKDNDGGRLAYPKSVFVSLEL